MRYLLYIMVYSCLILSLFATFLYLMTVVDPGLMDVPEKAAKMIQSNIIDANRESARQLPQEMYIDFSELRNSSKTLV